MSRFYEALKEASRSPAQPDGDSGEMPQGALETAGGNAPGIHVSAVQERDLSKPHRAPHRAPHPAPHPEPQIPELSADLPKPDLPKPDLLKPDLREGAKAPLNGSAPASEADLQSGPVQSAVSTATPRKVQISFDPNARLITQAADTVVVEHYRRLRTKILQQHADKPFKSLLVASPSPQEGKTVTVLNLALSFAMLPDLKVLVVDGDLRRGTIGKLLGADDHPGLSDLMEGTVELNDVVLRCPDLPVHFAVRGNSKVPPAELLHSSHVAGLFRQMTEEFDLVLVDSPPVGMLTDAQLLAGSCDAVLLIARAFSTTRKALEQTARELSAFRIIGTVLNGGTRTQTNRRYNGYY